MYISIPYAFLSVGPSALLVAAVLILIHHYDHDFSSYHSATISNKKTDSPNDVSIGNVQTSIDNEALTHNLVSLSVVV
jgi:hypothetical protein